MVRQILSPNLIGALCGLGFASLLSAQLTSGTQNITVNVQAAESISIVLTVGGPVNIPLPSVGQTNGGSVVPAWTTSWVLASSRTSVKVYAYFVGAPLGTNPANDIPAANFLGRANGGVLTTFSAGAIAAVNPLGVGMLVSTTAITSGNLTGSKSDSLALSLTTGSNNYVIDNYTGVLNIQAQATP